MPEKHYPGETVGIIGNSMASALLAQSAGKLGYRVASLVTTELNPVRQFSSWQTVTQRLTDEVLQQFGSRVDVIVTEKNLLTNRDYLLLNELTDLPLSEDLIAITTDRLIEKAYLDSIKALVAPFSMVTNLSDIKEAVEYIGFPCILKTTQRHTDHAHDHIVLYSEDDFPEAEAKVEESTCILEAWIPAEKKASLTVIRNERGEVLIYPIFEVIQSETTGTQVRYPASVQAPIEQEINRLGLMIAESLNLIGSLTIQFLITSAGVIYINNASIGLNEEAIFTIGSMSQSHFDVSLRALVGLPLPELRPLSKAAIAIPIASLNTEKVLTQYMLRTDWSFVLFNPMGNQPQDLMGHVIITGDTIAGCERQIELTEINRFDD
ncbi:ATP-grasp domain-containing protein [Fundicoccus culcitae]|uniref:ATP-grasp domain-containing protein n=1 Tax=Fundicoccus culcitae TaxID=2969821 RepID=A0ABY5P551_9LACT|nr:ATP-grasp domain-containing protein [Fundicoccus culcitae]UUX33822.1 ATP-grasp domain-containing protein [Fundicoccus culcitae]